MRNVIALALLGACGYPQPADVQDLPADAFVIPIDAPGTMAPVPPSCTTLAMTCGPAGTDSCCTSPAVPGGTYKRGFDMATDGQFTDATHPATVDSFHLDKYEVTVGRFRAFLAAGEGVQSKPPASGAGAHANISASGWQSSDNAMLQATTAMLTTALKCDSTFATWTDAAAGNESRPINCITWFEAMAFCAFDGGFLPSEAEWNLAAAGGDMQRAFPWSSPAASTNVDPSFASFRDASNNCNGDGTPACAITDLIDVGTKSPAGDGAFGQSDLGGNVDEWVLDASAPSYADPCTNCADLTLTAAGRVQRGGSFHSGANTLRSGFRANVNPASRDPFTGVRCARPFVTH